jgi:hypothetical protein
MAEGRFTGRAPGTLRQAGAVRFVDIKLNERDIVVLIARCSRIYCGGGLYFFAKYSARRAR